MAARIAELDAETVQNIVSLRHQGLSFRKVAAATGLSHGRIMRVVEWQRTGEKPKPSQPRIPKRPRNGQAKLPDFARIASLEAAGRTVKGAWQDYAQSNSGAYSYAHISTLYRVWLDEQADMRRQPEVPAHHSGAPLDEEAAAAVPDFSADEDQRAALYWRQRADPRSAVHVLHGHGCSLKVKNGDLVCFDTGSERSFPKVTHRLCAIIFLGTSGQITVDAIKWCEAQGVGIYVLGWHGELISATQPSPSANVLLRRAQFAADRVRMAKLILMQKTAGQARIGKLSAETQRKTLAQIKTARSVDELLIIEAHAALGYWANWRFAVKHKKRNWPDAWTQFTHRASPISGGPRHAMHPVNAMLNYAYSIAAAQITRALAVQGFDPACGFLHADAPGRYSLTYDVMELVRADIDATLLPWIASHTWKRPDFPVTPEGTVRLQPALAAVVAQKAAIPQRDIDRAIEWLADAVRQAA